jgi:hypothetical protein
MTSAKRYIGITLITKALDLQESALHITSLQKRETPSNYISPFCRPEYVEIRTTLQLVAVRRGGSVASSHFENLIRGTGGAGRESWCRSRAAGKPASGRSREGVFLVYILRYLGQRGLRRAR